jgi:hypothetical protein
LRRDDAVERDADVSDVAGDQVIVAIGEDHEPAMRPQPLKRGGHLGDQIGHRS